MTRTRIGIILAAPLVAIVVLLLHHAAVQHLAAAAPEQHSALELMSVSWGSNLQFEANFLSSFGHRNRTPTEFVPNTRLETYRQLLRRHTNEPDLLEVDIVWPPILAEGLVDLKPYLKGREQDFPAQLLENYTVNGRLVALPVYVDFGVLYYRPDLLKKYGFAKPPDTWGELEVMARRIQDGERRAGNKDFWGFTWQGSASEGGTCNALEWQASAGAGNLLERGGTVHVNSARFANALRRTAGWLGTISPPAQYVYREDDSVNLWDAGQAAFMRNWASAYAHVAQQPGGDRTHFGVAPLPAGAGGHKGTLGGLGMAVSKYAANREMAIKALLELTDEANDLARLAMTGGIPTHTAVLERADVKARSPLLAISSKLVEGSVSRPSLLAGSHYDEVSLAYATAVSSVLHRRAAPEPALADLEKQLSHLTGFPPQHD